MNASSPLSKPKPRQIPPLAWAAGATLLLHGAFLLALWLWPRPPVKARETLLEVDLTHDKTQIAPRPTVAPLKPVPVVAPRPQLKPRLATQLKTRVAKLDVPKPPLKPIPLVAPPVVKLPVAIPTAAPVVTKSTQIKKPDATKKIDSAIAPTPAPQKADKRPETVQNTATTRRTSARPDPLDNSRATRQPDKPRSGSPSTTRTTEAAPAPGGRIRTDERRSARRARRNDSRSDSPANPNSTPASALANNQTPAPSGGESGRRFARSDQSPDEPQSGERRSSTASGANPGSNARGRSEETAGAQPGLELPRTTRSGRGRSAPLDAPSGSAPTSSKDGTEIEIGPSSPGSSGGGRRLVAGVGDGDDASGPSRRNRSGAAGSANIGHAKTGRGAEEAAGEGVQSGERGSGARGSSSGARRGRGGSRLAGDPFGSGGGDGKRNGSGAGDDGAGKGPAGGTRVARRDLGEGNGEGEGTGFGRGTGQGEGEGNGRGQGKGNGGGQGTGDGRGTTGTRSGRGGDGPAEGTGGGGGGRARSGRGRGGRRASDTEDQIGRGIWGGFKIRFYQDKSDHPDLPDATFHPGNPIDWPVFTQLKVQKTVPNLDFDWGETPPAKGMKATFWSMKAQGRIFVPKDDTYEFFFDELDDAGSLVLDGKSIIKVWQVQKSSPSSGKMFLERGPHSIQIEYVQGPATAASIKLSWRSTSFPKEIVGVYQAPGNG